MPKVTIWNPRYVAYAREHGLEPEVMIQRDEDTYPGGRMAGFIVWIGEKWDAYASEVGKTHERQRGLFPLLVEDHEAFNKWLGLP